MPSNKPALKSQNQPLTAGEQAFVEHYLITFNAAKSALRAGFCEQNPVNSKIIGWEMLSKPYIKRAIDNRIASVCMDANEVLGRLAAIARGDIMDFMSKDTNGNWFFDFDKAETSGSSFLIKSITPTREGPKVELYSALEALDRIAKHLNILKQPETEINVSLTAWAQFVQTAKSQSGIDLNATFVNEGRDKALAVLNGDALRAENDPDSNMVEGEFKSAPDEEVQPDD